MTSLPNSAVRSLRSQQDSSISLSTHWHFNYALRTSRRAPGRGKSSCDWRQTSKVAFIIFFGRIQSEAVRAWLETESHKGKAKCTVQNIEPKTKAGLDTDRHCHRRSKLLCFFTLGMTGGCWDGTCLTVISSSPAQNWCLETLCLVL